MQYRRARICGATYFFTVVTFRRRKILVEPENVILLRRVFQEIKKRHPFVIDAFVLLPDHIHCIWTLPKGDKDFSTRWRLIKSRFTRKCSARYKTESPESRTKKREQAIWQRRFWEHCIRDDRDFVRHVEYIHYNPVKHGLVKAPIDWEYSSLHRYVREGKYDRGWAAGGAVKFDPAVGNE